MISKSNTGAQGGDRRGGSSGIAVLCVMGVSCPPVLPAKAPVGWSLSGRTRFPSSQDTAALLKGESLSAHGLLCLVLAAKVPATWRGGMQHVSFCLGYTGGSGRSAVQPLRSSWLSGLPMLRKQPASCVPAGSSRCC